MMTANLPPCGGDVRQDRGGREGRKPIIIIAVKPLPRAEMGEMQQGPAIILVEPQLGENIGMVARAMANFGLAELRLVNPRDGWPSEKARAAASRPTMSSTASKVFDDWPRRSPT